MAFKKIRIWIRNRVFYVFSIALLLFTFFVLEPINESFYIFSPLNSSSLIKIDTYYWIAFAALACLYLFVIFFVLFKKGSQAGKKISNIRDISITIFVIAFNVFCLSFVIRVFVYQSALYLNTHYFEKKVVMTYKVQKLTTNTAFLINKSNSDDVLMYNDLDILNKERLSKNLDSIQNKNDADTIQVYFRKGFLSELYLK